MRELKGKRLKKDERWVARERKNEKKRENSIYTKGLGLLVFIWLGLSWVWFQKFQLAPYL